MSKRQKKVIDLETEFRQRKKKADQEWIDLIDEIAENSLIDKDKIARRMDACNRADKGLLVQGYKV